VSENIKEGMESSEGNPVVLLVLNVVLSAFFAYTVLWLSDLAGITEFTLQRFVGFMLIIMVLTFVMTR